MSQTEGASCLTCREHAPLVGDFGQLGNPAIEVLRVCAVSGGEEDVPSFGYLYEGLVAVGLRRFDLSEFADWLRKHAGHHLALSAAGNNPEVAALEMDPRIGEEAELLWDAAPRRLEAALASGEYRLSRHHAACAACGVSITSVEPEPFLTFHRHRVDAAAIRLFLDRWAEWDDSWTYRLFGAVDPFEDYLPSLVQFATNHGVHGIEVELRAA